MKFIDLLKKPITLITENDILKDVVKASDSAQFVLDKMKDKNPQDILIVYVDDALKVTGIVTDANINSFFDQLSKIEKPLNDIKVSDLSWEVNQDSLLTKNDSIYNLLKKLNVLKLNIFIVVDDNKIYSGKVKRNSAIQKIKELVD